MGYCRQQYGIRWCKYQNIMVTAHGLKKLVRFLKKASKVFAQNLTSFFDLQPRDFPTSLWQSQKIAKNRKCLVRSYATQPLFLYLL